MQETLQGKRLLIVEDEADHLELIRRCFEDAAPNCELITLGTLAEARSAIAASQPDLLLIDYRLPDGEGRELVAEVSSCIPSVLMTSHGSEKVAVEVMKAGALDYIVKSPETFETIPRIVERALREWHLLTEQKRIATVVRESEERYRTLFTGATEGIITGYDDGRIAEINEAFARMHGYTVEEMEGMTLRDLSLIDLSKTHPERIRRLDAGETLFFEVEHRHKSGKAIQLEVSARRLKIGGQSYFVSFHRDVTERRAAERRQAALEKQLQQAQKLESLGVLAGGIAHDFNNLLTVILGNLSLVQDDLPSDSQASENLQRIERAAQRAAELCRQMLTYAGKAPSVLEAVSLPAVVEEMTSLLKSSISKKALLEFVPAAVDLPKIKADPTQLRQIVMNLIINASDALGNNPGQIRVEISPTSFSAGDAKRSFLGDLVLPGPYLVLEVADNGCGMDTATRQRIFEPFFTTKFTGRGLGMSAVLGILRTHRGFLDLESEPGKGTTFRIYFPTAAADSQQPHGTLPNGGTWKTGATVLLVDDEEMIREVGERMLRMLGFKVLTAENGRLALDLLAEKGKEIELLLLDLHMPVLDGQETLVELRKTAPTLPVILTSGYSDQEKQERFPEDASLGFLHKPYSLDSLKRTLAECFNRFGAAR